MWKSPASRRQPKTHGTPGQARRRLVDDARAVWSGLRVRARWTVCAGIIAVCAGAGAFGWQTWSAVGTGAIVGVVAVCLLILVLKFPRVLVTAATLIVLTPLVLIASAATSRIVGGPFAFPQVTMTPTMMWALCAAVLLHRSSGRRIWLRLSAVTLAAAYGGWLLGLMFGTAGVFAGFVLSAGVLVAVTDARDWVAGVGASVVSAYRRLRGLDVPDAVSEDLVLIAAAEDTAQMLTGLPADAVIWHDQEVRGRRGYVPVDHVAVTAAGVFVLANVVGRGVASHSMSYGVRAGSVDLVAALERLGAQCTSLHSRLAGPARQPQSTVTGILVVHGVKGMDEPWTVEMTSADGFPVPMLMVSPEFAVPAITSVPSTYSNTAVGQLTRIVRRGLRPARPENLPDPVGEAAELTADGLNSEEFPEPLQTTGPDDADAVEVGGGLVPGRKIVMLTSDGIFGGARATSAPYTDDSGALVVNVCTDGEWRRHIDCGVDAASRAYPVASVRPL